MTMINNLKTVRNSDIFIALGIFQMLTFGFFCAIGNYILFFQETQSLFLFSGEYLHKYLLKPGGLLEFAAKFLTQFYPGRFSGSLILSLILTIPGLILFRINKRFLPGTAFSLVLLVIPSMLLLIMQTNYFHMMEYNLGFIMVLLYYLFATSSEKKYHRILVLILFPLLYYLIGAYIGIVLVMLIVHSLSLESGRKKYVYPLFLLAIGATTFLIYWKVVFLQPVEQLLLFPLPLLENPSYRITFVIITGYLIFYPFIIKKTILSGPKKLNSRLNSFISTIIISLITIFFLFRIYNPLTARVIELERRIFAEKWDEAIRYQESHPSNNLIGEYFYNVALSETDQLCERMFYGAQDFGTGSLVLPWGDIHLNRGAYFYYSIGLSNEAHRWAYEEMVVYGARPQNIKILAKTSLINGDYKMARKYLGILKRTLYYRKWAKEFENLADNPDLLRSHPELGPKLKILPKSNFFIQFNEPQNNLPLILESQPDNMKAFEYYLAGLLLTKNVELVIANIKKLKEIGYTKIPRHIEEAALIYYNSTGIFPDLGGLAMSNETMTRFSQYFTAYTAARQNPSLLKQKMQQKFGNTFWFYFHFK